MSEAQVFEVQCGACSSVFQIDATQAGTTVHCPHCQSAAEIPSLTEMLGDQITADEATPDSTPPEHPVARSKKSPRKKSAPKTSGSRPASQDKNSTEAEQKGSRGRVKATSARSSAKLLLKVSGMLYYVATFVAVAWSVQVVGTLYPIVNSGHGSYYNWFIQTMVSSAWSAALIGLLIAVAELIVVIIHIHQKLTSFD